VTTEGQRLNSFSILREKGEKEIKVLEGNRKEGKTVKD
jgi:hypothetical protein